MDNSRKDDKMVSFDLQDFNDFNLTAAGELQVYHGFRHPIHIEIGDDDLELTSITLPSGEDYEHTIRPDRLFILRNLSSDSPEARIVMDNVRRNIGSIALHDVEYEVQGRSTYIIGRGEDATPQLDLSKAVSRHHMHIRLGNMAGNLHFADLYSTNGTIVKLHEEDANDITLSAPSRHFFNTGNELITAEQRNQRWSR